MTWYSAVYGDFIESLFIKINISCFTSEMHNSAANVICDVRLSRGGVALMWPCKGLISGALCSNCAVLQQRQQCNFLEKPLSI